MEIGIRHQIIQNEYGSINSNICFTSAKDKQSNLDELFEYTQIYITRKTSE